MIMTKMDSPESLAPSDIANTVPSRSEKDEWDETCDRMYHRDVTIAQMEFVAAKNTLLQYTTPLNLHAVSIVNQDPISYTPPHIEAADELAGCHSDEKILECIESLRSDLDTAIKAIDKLRKYRKASFQVYEARKIMNSVLK